MQPVNSSQNAMTNFLQSTENSLGTSGASTVCLGVHLRYTIQREILLRRWAHEPGMQAYRVSAGLEALPPVPPSEPLQTDAIPDVLGMPIARAEQLARQLLRVPEIIRRLRADGFVPAVAQTGCVQ